MILVVNYFVVSIYGSIVRSRVSAHVARVESCSAHIRVESTHVVRVEALSACSSLLCSLSFLIDSCRNRIECIGECFHLCLHVINIACVDCLLELFLCCLYCRLLGICNLVAEFLELLLDFVSLSASCPALRTAQLP